MASKRLVVIGGGAAGFFGGITAAEANPGLEVVIIEKSPNFLTKVKISGGGRCNVTHNCFDPKVLVNHYPRGNKELLGAFHQFQPRDIIAWFKRKGVELKVEPDGRMFPVTDDSQTIIDCFLKCVDDLNISLVLKTSVESVEPINGSQFKIVLNTEEVIICDKVLLATGGGQSNKGFQIAQSLGHTISPPVPSLFTFNIKDSRLMDLQGISFASVNVKIPGTKLQEKGPLLITHWGLSGPAILRLSAWGARILEGKEYRFELNINFLPQFTKESLVMELKKIKNELKLKQVSKNPLFALPKRFWEQIVSAVGFTENQTWNQSSEAQIQNLAEELTEGSYKVDGKSTNKDEFVTCGGVMLKEVNFKTMESKICPGLYFAGEVLDIDGITGGFNFQAAWTEAWIAGTAMKLCFIIYR